MAPSKCKQCEHYDSHEADKDHTKGEWCYMFVNPVKGCTKFSLAKKVMEQVEWLNEQINKQVDLNSKLAVECEKKQKQIVSLNDENAILREENVRLFSLSPVEVKRFRDALMEIATLDANEVQFRYLRAESIARKALEI